MPPLKKIKQKSECKIVPYPLSLLIKGREIRDNYTRKLLTYKETNSPKVCKGRLKKALASSHESAPSFEGSKGSSVGKVIAVLVAVSLA